MHGFRKCKWKRRGRWANDNTKRQRFNGQEFAKQTKTLFAETSEYLKTTQTDNLRMVSAPLGNTGKPYDYSGISTLSTVNEHMIHKSEGKVWHGPKYPPQLRLNMVTQARIDSDVGDITPHASHHSRIRDIERALTQQLLVRWFLHLHREPYPPELCLIRESMARSSPIPCGGQAATRLETITASHQTQEGVKLCRTRYDQRESPRWGASPCQGHVRPRSKKNMNEDN